MICLAREEFGSQVKLQRIEETFHRVSDHLRELTFTDGAGRTQTIKTTDEHPFWIVEQNKFVNAAELAIGTTVTGPHGEHQTLTATRREMYLSGVPVYNFRVAEFHTYFVGERPDDKPLLTHNACATKATKDADGRITKAESTVGRGDLGNGTGTTKAARNLAGAGDDAGHLIARVLGGRGGKNSGNILPMESGLNRGRVSAMERDIAGRLRTAAPGTTMDATVDITYPPSGGSRPWKFKYTFMFSDGRDPVTFEFEQ